MVDAYSPMMAEFEERKVLYADRYCPFYIISVGSHLFNILNKQKHLYLQHGLPVDTRCHIFLVCPSGFGKSFHIRQFLENGVGVLDRSPIQHAMEGSMTESAWVGSVIYVDGEPVIVEGAAKEYEYGIVGVEEFSVLTQMMQSASSRTLHSQLLTSLDSGIVRKRLRGSMKIHYTTCVTLWTGDRPATFDMASGMPRRLVFLNFFPTKRDVEMMRRAIRSGEGIKYNPARLVEIGRVLEEKIEELKQLTGLVYDTSMYAFLDRIKQRTMPYEEIIYKRLAIGYNVLKKNLKGILRVEVDKTLDKLLMREYYWRQQIKRGADVSHVFVILSDYGNKMTRRDLVNRLSDFGLNTFEAAALIDRMLKERMLVYKNGYLSSYYVRSEE